MKFHLRFGGRRLILTSLYLSVLSTIICAIVANYTTLLLSRALLGFCCGLRCSTLYVWASELVSSNEIVAKILFVTHIMFHMGECGPQCWDICCLKGLDGERSSFSHHCP